MGNLEIFQQFSTLMARIVVLKASKNIPFSSFSSIHTMLFSKCAGCNSIFKIYRLQNLPTKM